MRNFNCRIDEDIHFELDKIRALCDCSKQEIVNAVLRDGLKDFLEKNRKI